jgi:hypothetical protein
MLAESIVPRNNLVVRDVGDLLKIQISESECKLQLQPLWCTNTKRTNKSFIQCCAQPLNVCACGYAGDISTAIASNTAPAITPNSRWQPTCTELRAHITV